MTAKKDADKFSCLIVEDDAGFATMAGQVVREEGAAVVHAASLAAAPFLRIDDENVIASVLVRFRPRPSPSAKV